jgi:hypothetical protein
MKISKNIILKIVSILVIGISMTSCEKLLEDARIDPDVVSEVDDKGLFAQAARQLFLQTTDVSVIRFAGMYGHYFVSGSDSRTADMYLDGFNDRYEEIYEKSYGEVIRYAEETLYITSTGDTKNEVRHAMADVISVIGFARITDGFGDIPYTEGGKGKTEEIILPKYDTQEFIYTDMINRLGKSIEVLKNADSDDAYDEADFIFANDMDKWVRFANSMRLRLAMRVRYSNETLSRETVTKCLSEPLMETVEDDAWMIDTEDPGNEWYYASASPGVKLSDLFITMLKDTHDPRIEVFAALDADGGYSGQLNGLKDAIFAGSGFGKRSNMGLELASKDSKLYLLTAAETWFLRAEAALVYDGDEVKANENFRNGIETSLIQWNVPRSERIVFMDSDVAKLSGDISNKEEQIGNQLWIALTPNYYEGWAHARRTGYPVVANAERTDPKLERGVTNGIMPKRFKYSSFELSNNGENVEKAIERQGPNKIDTPVWWDKNN